MEDSDFYLPDKQFAKLPKLWVCLRSLTNKLKIKLRLQNISSTPQKNEPWYRQEKQDTKA